MNVLLTCATDAEGKPLRKLLSAAFPVRQDGGISFWEAGRNQIQMLRTGISMETTAQTLRRYAGWAETSLNSGRSLAPLGVASGQSAARSTLPDAVIVFGIAGQLYSKADIATIAIPRIWRCELRERTLECSSTLFHAACRMSAESRPTEKILWGGTGISLFHPAVGTEQRAMVRRRFPDVTICDMETFAIMDRFTQTACLAIRIVSDDGSEVQSANEADAFANPHMRPETSKRHVGLPLLAEHCANLAQFVYQLLDVVAGKER